jgi:hypothetical protein
MPNFRAWAENNLGLNIDNTTPAQDKVPCDPPMIN